MPDKFVLDSCAMLAFIYREAGDEVVKYDIMRSRGLQQAERYYAMVKESPIQIINGIADLVFRKAGILKTQYKMSLADSIALAEAYVMDATILTSDHHEFDAVEKSEGIKFLWIR